METLETGRFRLPFGNDVIGRLNALLRGVGLELCHADWKRGRSRGVLTLYVDKPGGVSLDDCEAASRSVEPFLEEVPELASLPGSWSLEVSSPGLDRPLWTLSDCVRFRGRRVRVETRTPVEGTSRVKGVLEGVEGDALTVLDEDRKRRYTVCFGDVKVARLVPEF